MNTRRLSELKIILDKYRPMEKKFKYQIDKILSLQYSDSSSVLNDSLVFEEKVNDNSLSLRPNPESMIEGEQAEEKKEKEEEKGKRGMKYQCPRLTSIHYQREIETKEELAAKEAKKHLNQMRQSEILQTLKGEYMNMPDEEDTMGGNKTMVSKARQTLEKRHEDVTKFEEERMTRFVVARKDRKERNRLDREEIQNSLLSVGKLGDLAAGISAFKYRKREDRDRMLGTTDDFSDEAKRAARKKDTDYKFKNPLQKDLYQIDNGDKSNGKQNKKRKK